MTNADWITSHAVTLASTDADAPLDDLEPLGDLIGDARIVAVGEGAHFVREYWLMRRRLLRFLAERHGFRMFALEYGVAEGFALDRWLQGEGGPDELGDVAPAAAGWGARDTMHWLRSYNAVSARPIRFAGIDIPEGGGCLLPALEPLADYLRDVDPEALGWAEVALGVASRFASGSAASAAPAWTELGPAAQDALTAGLARLVQRFRALEPLYVERGGSTRYAATLRELEAAVCGDYMVRSAAGMFAGGGLQADASVRERFMAESVRRLLEDDDGPDVRVVLAAHNNHIQKTPVAFGGSLYALPMGAYLREAFGPQYLAIALTSTDRHVPEMTLDPGSPVGFRVVDTHVGEPEAGSVEAAVRSAGFGDEVSLLDVRGWSGEGAQRIRTQSSYMETPVAEAFDAVITMPTVTMDDSLHFEGEHSSGG